MVMRWFSKLRKYNPYRCSNIKIITYHDSILTTNKALQDIIDTLPELHKEILTATCLNVRLHSYFTDLNGVVLDNPNKEFDRLNELVSELEGNLKGVVLGDALFSRYKRIESYLIVIKNAIKNMKENC